MQTPVTTPLMVPLVVGHRWTPSLERAASIPPGPTRRRVRCRGRHRGGEPGGDQGIGVDVAVGSCLLLGGLHLIEAGTARSSALAATSWWRASEAAATGPGFGWADPDDPNLGSGRTVRSHLEWTLMLRSNTWYSGPRAAGRIAAAVRRRTRCTCRTPLRPGRTRREESRSDGGVHGPLGQTCQHTKDRD